jgi:hypothetical protein
MRINTCPRCRGGPSSISDQSFWCRKRHWDGYFYPSNSVFPACITPAHLFHLTSTLHNPSNQQHPFQTLFTSQFSTTTLRNNFLHREAIGSETQPAPCSMVNEGSLPGIKMADTWHQHSSRFVTEVKSTYSPTCIVPYGCTVRYLIKLREIYLHRYAGLKKSLKLSQLYSPSKFSAISHFSVS